MIFATNKDVVFVENLRVQTIIGIYDWERVTPQPVLIDLALFNDTQQVAHQHSLADGVNYKEVCEAVSHWTQSMQAQLVEELAEHLAEQLLKHYPISKVTIKISKPMAIKEASGVGVQITRERMERID